ncbi:hypothetical protein [Sphaerochaeta sp.]|jgi:hypothetical protein
MVEGTLLTDGQEVPFHRAVLFGEGNTLSLSSGEAGVRSFLYAENR